MQLLFDYQAFEMQRFGGISRSYAELISHLRDEGCRCYLGLKESDNEYIKLQGLKPFHYTHDKYLGRKKWFKGQRTLTRMLMGAIGYRNSGLDINKDYCIKLLKRQEFDVFEPTFFDPYFLPYLKNKPFVLTVHDMIPELFHFHKDDIQVVNKKLLCPLASAIHVPSMRTKEDLVNILNVDPAKIEVIGHGSPPIKASEAEPQRLIEKPYLLYVGERGGYKNFDLLLREMSILIRKNPDLNLICTGHPFDYDERHLLVDLGLTEHIHSFFVTEDAFYSLYHHAVAFVYPSAYEGFGIPILEAFVYESPALLNNASCFPEVGGDAALYFDINQEGHLAEQVTFLLQCGEDVRQEIINRGKKRAEKFSWNDSAKKMMRLYERLI